ncbi:hypothetical protein Q666_00990 [Marinobacter sp. ES-1]|nr:hypothetical protein Q666_00990 [Marinobacter sp. ES-1]
MLVFACGREMFRAGMITDPPAGLVNPAISVEEMSAKTG